MEERKSLAIVAILLGILLIITLNRGPSQSPATTTASVSSTLGGFSLPGNSSNATGIIKPARMTFIETNNSVCTQNGKPIIRMYSTTTCPHCRWIKDTFDKVAREYVNESKIVAHHYEFDSYDDTLTPAYEGTIPQGDVQLFSEFNPKNSVPTFIFGCKYYRVGNGYEAEGDLSAEEAEFRYVIEELLKQVKA